MAAPTLTDEGLADILDATSYAEMQERAAKYGIDLEAGVMEWEVGAAAYQLTALSERRAELRDVERSEGMTLGEKQRVENVVAAAAGQEPPNPDVADTIPVAEGADTAEASSSPSSFMEMFGANIATSPTALPESVPFLTDSDIQMIFRRTGSDMAALNTYEDRLAQYRASIDPTFEDPFRVQLDPETGEQRQAQGRLQRAYVPGGASDAQAEAMMREINRLRGRAEGESSYTLSQAANLLYGMTPGEIRQLQRKLQQAGYFETASGADGEPLFWGDPTDSRTQSAWMNLLGDAVRMGAPVYDMLDRRLQTAREAGFGEDGTRDGTDPADQPPVRLTDDARIRENADQMARDTIGRKLTPEEQAGLVEFIHGLERDNQALPTTSATATTDERFAQVPEGQDVPERYTGTGTDAEQDGAGERREIEDVDVNAQIAEYIRRENPTEAGGRDVALTYNDFTSLLAGPGRGGSF